MRHFENFYCWVTASVLLVWGGSLEAETLYSPVGWSRSGRELAFLAQGGDEEKIFPKGWIWGLPTKGPVAETGGVRRELWVYDVVGGRGVRVEETEGWLSAPGWTASGDAVTYVVCGRLADGKGASELVRRFPDGKREVLFREELELKEDVNYTGLAREGVAWSSNGRYVAFPWPAEPTLRVMDVERGEMVATYAGGSLPSWSPSGKWLVFYRAGEGHGFRAVEAGAWSESPGKVSAAGDQAVLWDPGEEAFYLLRPLETEVADANRIEFPLGRRQRLSHHVLERVRVPAMTAQVAARFLRPIRPERERILVNWDYATARDEVVVSTLIDALVSPVAFHPLFGTEGEEEMRPTLHPLFDAIPVGVPRFQPDGKGLAFRFGMADAFAAVAVREREEDRLRFMTPNSASRLRGAWSVVVALGRYARASGNDAPVSFGIDARPTRAEEYRVVAPPRPVPLDLFDLPHRQSQRDSDAAEAIDRLSGAGLELLAEDVHQGGAWSELRLLFHYLRRDYERVLAELERVDLGEEEGVGKGPALAASMVRLQALWGLGRKEAAIWEWNRLAHEMESIRADHPSWLGKLGEENPSLAKQFHEVLERRLTKFERIFAGEETEREVRGDDDGDRPAAEN